MSDRPFELLPAAGNPAARQPVLYVQRGHRPYLWIGDDDGRGTGFYATLEGRVQLRRLRDALTVALRRRRRKP